MNSSEDHISTSHLLCWSWKAQIVCPQVAVLPYFATIIANLAYYFGVLDFCIQM